MKWSYTSCKNKSGNFSYWNSWWYCFWSFPFVFEQRLYGFVICLAAGLTCTLLVSWSIELMSAATSFSSVFLSFNHFIFFQSMLVFFNPIKFGVTFTFGNLLALGRYVFFNFCSVLHAWCSLSLNFRFICLWFAIHGMVAFLFRPELHWSTIERKWR